MFFSACVAALASALVAVPAGGGGRASSRAALAVRVTPGTAGAPGGAFRATYQSAAGRARAQDCAFDVCPNMNVPGMELRDPGVRPRRSEMVLRLVERSGIEPFASIAAWAAEFPLRVVYDPPGWERGTTGPVSLPGRDAWGRVVVTLRWRLDAENRPVLPPRFPGVR